MYGGKKGGKKYKIEKEKEEKNVCILFLFNSFFNFLKYFILLLIS